MTGAEILLFIAVASLLGLISIIWACHEMNRPPWKLPLSLLMTLASCCTLGAVIAVGGHV